MTVVVSNRYPTEIPKAWPRRGETPEAPPLKHIQARLQEKPGSFPVSSRARRKRRAAEIVHRRIRATIVERIGKSASSLE